MAISNLVTGGQSFSRPSVSAFFGKSPTSANDNVEQISSNFLSKELFRSVLDSIDIVGKELKKLTDLSKNIIKSFDNLIKNTRDLNRDITRRFRDVNEQLNQSRMDFLRSVMLTPVPASDRPTTIGALVDKAEQNQKAIEQTNQENAPPGKSWLDTMGDLLDYLPDFGNKKTPGAAPKGTGIFDRLKSGARGAVRAGRSVPGMIMGALAGAAVGNALESSIEESKGEFKNKVYVEKISGIIKDHPNKDKLITAFNSMEPKDQEQFFMKHFHAFAFKTTNEEGVRKLEELAGVPVGQAPKSAYARGLHDTDARGYLPDSEISSNRSMTTESDSTGRIRQTTTSGIINERSENDSTMRMNTFAEKGTQTGVMMGTSMTSNEKGIDELKEFFGQRISGGFMRRDSYQVQYKGKDLELNKTEYFQVRNHVEAGDYPSAFKILDKLALRKERQEFVAKGGKPSEFGKPEPAPAAPAAPAAGGGTEGAGGPDQKQQQQAPAAPAGGTEGTGAPEKAPSGGGAGTGGGESAAGTPTAAPAPAPTASSGGGGGESSGAPAATTTPTAPAAAAAAGSAEGMTGSPSGTGTPEAAPAAPSTPPAPPATPEAASGSANPIVMNNSSSQSIGSSTPGETSNMSGQNLPMNAQNDKIQEYLAKQTVAYQ